MERAATGESAPSALREEVSKAKPGDAETKAKDEADVKAPSLCQDSWGHRDSLWGVQGAAPGPGRHRSWGREGGRDNRAPSFPGSLSLTGP